VSLIYTDEHLQLHDSARDFLGECAPVSQQRRLRDEAAALGFDAAVWQDMLKLGWGALASSAELGGLDFGCKGFAPVFEQLGRHLSASPLLSSVVLCAGLIERLGSPEQQQAWVPALTGGEKRLALALEEHPRHGAGEIALQARPQGEGWCLSGRKCWVLDGVGVDGWLVVARLENGARGVFLVPGDAAGADVEPLRMIDSRNHAGLLLGDVHLPASAQLGAGAEVEAALEWALDRARACLAAELLGMSETIFKMTTDYLKTRVQFDVPIGSFQALQHRAARLYVDLQLARSAVMAAFEALEEDAPDAAKRARLVSLGKWKANETAQQVSNEAVQMHGGIGVTDELDLGLYLKRIRVAQACLGDSDYHCARYAASLGR